MRNPCRWLAGSKAGPGRSPGASPWSPEPCSSRAVVPPVASRRELVWRPALARAATEATNGQVAVRGGPGAALPRLRPFGAGSPSLLRDLCASVFPSSCRDLILERSRTQRGDRVDTAVLSEGRGSIGSWNHRCGSAGASASRWRSNWGRKGCHAPRVGARRHLGR
jgi:hypothetical protein